MSQKRFRWDRLGGIIGLPLLAAALFSAIFGTFYGIGFGLSHLGTWPEGSIHTLRILTGMGTIGLIGILVKLFQIIRGICEWFYEPKED